MIKTRWNKVISKSSMQSKQRAHQYMPMSHIKQIFVLNPIKKSRQTITRTLDAMCFAVTLGIVFLTYIFRLLLNGFIYNKLKGKQEVAVSWPVISSLSTSWQWIQCGQLPHPPAPCLPFHDGPQIINPNKPSLLQVLLVNYMVIVTEKLNVRNIDIRR